MINNIFRKVEVVVMDSGPLPSYFNEKENNKLRAIATNQIVWLY